MVPHLEFRRMQNNDSSNHGRSILNCYYLLVTTRNLVFLIEKRIVTVYSASNVSINASIYTTLRHLKKTNPEKTFSSHLSATIYSTLCSPKVKPPPCKRGCEI